MTTSGWKLDQVAATDALRLLKQSKVILMPVHQNVDADGLSSPLAIMHSLAQIRNNRNSDDYLMECFPTS